MEEHLPGLRQGIVAGSLFNLLRSDVLFCRSVSTSSQAAEEAGVPVGELTRSDAKWLGDGRADLIGPKIDAVWGQSPEEQEQAERAAEYARQQEERLWTESIVFVCSHCKRFQPCPCGRTSAQRANARRQQRTEADNIRLGRNTRHWKRLRAERLSLVGHCQLRHEGCTRIATTVHLVGGGDHATATLVQTKSRVGIATGSRTGKHSAAGKGSVL